MVKYVYLTLSNIKYSWESIGDDIIIEIEALDQFATFNKELENWEIRELNDKIGAFKAFESPFTIPITLRIIERDLVFALFLLIPIKTLTQFAINNIDNISDNIISNIYSSAI